MVDKNGSGIAIGNPKPIWKTNPTPQNGKTVMPAFGAGVVNSMPWANVPNKPPTPPANGSDGVYRYDMSVPHATSTKVIKDGLGNSYKVTYDQRGNELNRERVTDDGTFAHLQGGTADTTSTQTTGTPMNAGNWQKLMDLLRSKFGISL